MDSLTHLLVGHAMGAAASSIASPHGAAAYWAVLIGNSLPDIDVPISLIWRRDIKLHRTVTHTIPGVAALSVLTALVLGQLIPGVPFVQIFFWTMLGSLAHMAMDCLNVFGARALWPLSHRSYEYGILHIFDPVLLLMLGLAAVAVKFGLASYALLSLAFVSIWPYILYRAATARKLYRKLKALGSHRARVIPWFASWKYVFETAQGIEFGHWRGEMRHVVQTYPRYDSPLIRASLQNPQVTAFLASAEYPYARVEEDEHGHAVVWGDALRQMRADFRPLKVRVEGSL